MTLRDVETLLLLIKQTVGLDEAFLPLWELEEVGEGWSWWRSHLWQRAVFAASVAALLWALSRVAPGTGESVVPAAPLVIWLFAASCMSSAELTSSIVSDDGHRCWCSVSLVFGVHRASWSHFPACTWVLCMHTYRAAGI
jgi:hypothetical protein